MPDSQSASDASIVSRDRVCQIVQGILRGAQTVWTDESLSAACGVSARAIKAYRVEGKEPSLSNAMSIAVVLGPNALNAILAAIGYVARPLEDADAISPSKIVADGLAAFSVIATAAADNHIDHIEAPLCRDAADTIIATVLPLSSAGRAA